MAGLSNVVVVLRPASARCVVLVRRCLGPQWSARPGLRGGPYGTGWRCFVAVAVPFVICFLSGVFCCG